MRSAQQTDRLTLSGYPLPVHVHLDPRMTSLVLPLLSGWRISTTEWTDDADDDPDIVLKEEAVDGRFAIAGRHIGQDYTLADPVDAACSFVAETLNAQARSLTDGISIHAAGVVLNGRAVIFPAGFRAGKSTLTAVLAARGMRIISDDVVYIATEGKYAVGPGISPRLRLPWPGDLDQSTGRFISETMELAGKRYGYLSLPGDLQMPNGERVPIGAFVFPNRRSDGCPRLTEMAKSDALRTLVWQNFARQGQAGGILTRLSEIAVSRPTLALEYAKVEEAADILLDRFSSWETDAQLSETKRTACQLQWLARQLPPWQRNPGLVETEIDGGYFIADDDAGRIFHLNKTANAIWKLLAVGEDVPTITSLFTSVFSDVERSEVEADVERLMRSFRELGLLVSAGEAARMTGR